MKVHALIEQLEELARKLEIDEYDVAFQHASHAGFVTVGDVHVQVNAHRVVLVMDAD